MKTMNPIFNSKIIALLFTTALLFACTEIEDLNLNDEFAKKQEISPQLDKDTFVSLDKAADVADLFFSKLTEGDDAIKNSSRARKGSASFETLSERGNPLMYIINYPDGGFVIMGSTKNYYPVLAYSDENSFEIPSELNGVTGWLEETKEAIKTSNALKDSVKFAMKNLWKGYETADILTSKEAQDTQLKSSLSSGEIACRNRCDELQMQFGGEGWNFLPLSQAQYVLDDAGFSGLYKDLSYSAEFNHSPNNFSVFAYKNVYKDEQVGPLLTTNWYQSEPFNDLCNGSPAGCGAIAVAQVINHYKHPQSFSLNGYAFNWSNIPINPRSGSDHAALVRLVGININTQYTSSFSYATPANMESGIKLLGYNVTRANHNFETVKTQLFTYKRPVIMGGNANNVPLPSPFDYIGKSHYWICDGARQVTTGQMQYFTEWQPYGNGVFTRGWNTKASPGVLGGIGSLYFHMNWGWRNKEFNGWFAFNNVNSGNGDFKYARQDFYITKQ
ncbi:C10 family peptidase [Anditalea andensis]|uniref:Spi protease inhibitor domain-containing protein n=1 Tax=Anditalea andensis TaxID=1048983 RepID=A0A074L629_9BACT|nr:C10 family peptidase [Anditalea andensis]KEO75950.1 hypothetical protein EL17_00110 [Anditalea andensis]